MKATHVKPEERPRKGQLRDVLIRKAESASTEELFDAIIDLDSEVIGLKRDVVALRNVLQETKSDTDRKLFEGIVDRLGMRTQEIEALVVKLQDMREAKLNDRSSASVAN